MRRLVLLFVFALAFYQGFCQNSQPVYYAPEIFSASQSGAVCCFMNKGRTMIFVREDTIADKLFMYEAEMVKGKWTNAKLLPFSGVHNDMGGRLSQDQTTFYFTSDRPGGSSKPDDVWNIWVTRKTKTGWTQPTALISINEKGAECCAVPLSDKEILFSGDRDKATSWWIATHNLSTQQETFVDSLNGERMWQWPSYVTEEFLLLNSMRKENNLGKDDIYISFRRGGKLTQPINLGPAINTTVYEDGAILSPDGKLIFCRHETHETVSRVMSVEWKSIYERLQLQVKNTH